MSSNMVRRVAVAAVGIPAAVAVVYVGGWLLAALLALFGAVGALEVYRLAARAGLKPLVPLGLLGAGAFPLALYAVLGPLGHPMVKGLVFGATIWFVLVVSLGARQLGPDGRPLAGLAVTVFAPVYASALPAFLLAIRHGAGLRSSWAATALVFLPLVVTWLCDSFAMGGGAIFGGPKLAPVLSPRKTWSGAVSGSVGALVVAPLYGFLVLTPLGLEIGVARLAAFGLVISVVGQIGDLSESLFKREAGVKDSGTFFPGHGGVLDRFDSLYWVIPTSVILLSLYGVL